tara:strand:- start:724 stop:1545 length:822 start_codon:yes stop_codon:yes gene_type:complete
MSNTLTYRQKQNWNKSLVDYNNTKLYYSHNSSNCDEYAIKNNYPFYFKYDPLSKKPLKDTNGNKIEDKCIFRIDSSLNNFADDFTNNRYQDIKKNLNTYSGTNNPRELSSFFLYELDINNDLNNNLNNEYPKNPLPDNLVGDNNLKNMLYDLSRNYYNLLSIIYNNNSEEISAAANIFEASYNSIISLKTSVDKYYKLDKLIEYRKQFSNIVNGMDDKIYKAQNRLNDILQIDGANNGKLQDIEYMNYFILTKSILLILVLLVSSRYVIKYNK